MSKPMTLRLPDAQAAALAAVARADGMKISEAAREAIEKHIEERRADKEFQTRLQRVMEEDREILERLAR